MDVDMFYCNAILCWLFKIMVYDCWLVPLFQPHKELPVVNTRYKMHLRCIRGSCWLLQRLHCAVFIAHFYLCHGPAHVVQWSNHLGAMCSRAWRSQWPRIDSSLGPSASAYYKKELFQIIPMHMMTREIIPGRKTEGSTVSSINCDRSSLI